MKRKKRKCVRISHTTKREVLIQELVKEGVYYYGQQEST